MATYLKCKIQPNTFYKITENVVIVPSVGLEQNAKVGEIFECKFNGHTYQKNLLFLDFENLFNRMGKHWRCIENEVLTKRITGNSISNVKNITTLLLTLHCNLIRNVKMENTLDLLKYINLFKNSIYKLSEMNDDVLNTLTSVIVSSQEPLSHYFHSYVEIFHLILLIERSCKMEHIEETYKTVMLDLIKLSHILYQKHKQEILYTQPFSCLCVRNLWIYIMRCTSYFTFWTIFNNCITQYTEEFCSWLMMHISLLQNYIEIECSTNNSIKEEDVNIVLVNRILESTVSKPNELNLLNILKLLSSLLTELWIEHIPLDPYQILWDYFYKHLNNLESIELPKSVHDFMQTVDNIINNVNASNSYYLFLHLLDKHLSKHPSQWRKFQGRIYSRIPAQKIKEFNITAIYKISLLLFTMASPKRQEVMEKLNTILENLSSDQQKLDIIWILHINKVLVHIRHNEDISITAKTLLTLVQNGAECREDFHLMKHFVDGLGFVFDINDNLELGQNCLLSSWITPYLSTCSHAELYTLLVLLINILKKAEILGKLNILKTCYLQFVLPALKKISVTSSTPKIGELAGLIFLNMSDVTSGLLSFFCGDTINIEVANAFLSIVLINSPIGSIAVNQENILISAWCRISMLYTNTIDRELNQRIFNLHTIKNVVIIEEISNEPFVGFAKILSKQMSIQSKLFRLKELCEICFGNIDRWIPNYLTPATSEAQVLHLFTKVSLLFYYCAPLFYQKSKSFCILSRLISILLLPKEVLMGKLLTSNIMQAIEKTWHLFVKGINKLDYSSDPYIDRTLKDLIIRYLPHFSIKDSPILNILDNDKITAYTLEKISNAFLLHSARSSEENTYKTLKVVENILRITTDIFKIQNVIKKVLLGVFEVIMFNKQKLIALDIIKFITLSEWYHHIHSEIQQTVRHITEKHLAFNTNNYFQLIDILRQYLTEDIEACIPFIKEQITRVERMRGVGFDNTLRKALNRIESSTI